MKLSGFCKNASMGAKLIILFLLVIWGALATAIPMFFIKGPHALLTSVYLQNIIMFAIPAWMAAYLFWGNPGKSLHLNKLPTLHQLMYVVLLMMISLPMMNRVIEWNEAIHLPKALSGIETWLRQQENNAAGVTQQLLQTNSAMGFFAIILGVGVLTGIGEEFVFRGVLQQIFQGKRRRIHLAVWISAFVFSAIHFQFFGFFPRLLLGAFFGYLFVWSGNLWIPIFAHALNNSVVVFSYHFHEPEWLETVGTSSLGPSALPWISAVLTILFMYLAKISIFKK